MAFDYRKEKVKFERTWARLRKEYEADGMPQKEINTLYEFDLDWFRSRRRFANHTQELPTEQIEDEDESSSLVNKFESMRTVFDESAFESRFAWVDTIDNKLLVDKLRQLSDDDLELLTLIAFDGYSQSELARKTGAVQSVISRKLSRIKKLLK